MSSKEAPTQAIREGPRALATRAPVRLAIVSSPRSGTNWMRHLLSTAYAVPGLAVHNPAEVDWPALPPECVLSLHWHRTPLFLQQLAQHQFQVVVLTRHPLDMLVSILRFSMHAATARWLEGEEGDEQAIFGAMPRSAVFLDYAVSRRAQALLSVSREWWGALDCHCVRYGDLVHDAPGELHNLFESLGIQPRRPLSGVLEATTLGRLRSTTSCNFHFWQGKPGLWRSLLPAAEARDIARAHAECFQEFGYACDPDPELTALQADRNWIALAWADLGKDLHHLHQTELEHGVLQQGYQKLAQELEQTRCQLDALHQLGPVALGVARRLHGLALRCPGVVDLARRLLGRPRGA